MKHPPRIPQFSRSSNENILSRDCDTEMIENENDTALIAVQDTNHSDTTRYLSSLLYGEETLDPLIAHKI